MMDKYITTTLYFHRVTEGYAKGEIRISDYNTESLTDRVLIGTRTVRLKLPKENEND